MPAGHGDAGRQAGDAQRLDGLTAGDLVRAMVGRELAGTAGRGTRHAGRIAAERGAADP